ncbi:ExbD/TolR family protein [Notoacmeibacter ruber]|uniref:Biopolymer transporter ExbD n=1 Tax=Notoacmeibacter ruber TaxID=2670375 RepID=A0A3L7JCS0_9HYPH|nr:biopolymer transporter ExbD [Notoacmeibacter ruber]RLQ88254.1 biopolymer transporter ExbD [Notoacmeibacter ruber]
MVKLNPPYTKPREADSTIALINIVFLMLIFFLIAGTLTPPVDRALDPVTTEEATPGAPPDALAIGADGTMTWRGQPVTLEETLAAHERSGIGADAPLRILVDQSLPAPDLVDRLAELRRAGLTNLVLVTEREQN